MLYSPKNLVLESGSANIPYTETKTVNLSGGKLLVNGIVEAGIEPNVINAFNWTGGTLAVATFNAANLGGSLNQAGGTFAPGIYSASR